MAGCWEGEVGNPAAKVRGWSGVGVARRRKPRIHAKRERGIFGRFSGAVFGVISRGRKGGFSASKTRGSGGGYEGCPRGSDGGAILRAEGRRGKKVFACAGRAVSDMGQGCGGFGHFPRAHLSGTGKGRARSEGENFFSRQPFRSLSGGDFRLCAGFTERQQYGGARRTHHADKHQNVLVPFLGLVEHLCRVPFVSRRVSLRFRGAVLYRPADCVRVCPRRGGWKRKQDAADPKWTPRGARTCAARKKRKKV